MSVGQSKESVFKGCQKEEGEEEEMVSDTGEGKVCIQQILQEMTNEFNRGVNPFQHEKNDGLEKSNGEAMSQQEIFEVRVDESGKEEINSSVKDLIEKSVEEAQYHEHKETKEIMKNQSANEECHLKKDGVPRIVLTFRTIDEDTDYGKKTKISSLSSNLTLVPDELVNCNQIGGVSVKIETDENSDFVHKSYAEESKVDNDKKKEIRDVEKNEKEGTEKINDRVNLENLGSIEVSAIDKAEENRDEEVSVSESVTEEESVSNSSFIKKRRPRRLRVFRYVFAQFFHKDLFKLKIARIFKILI